MPTFLASERWFLLTLSNHQHLKRKVKTIQIDLLNLMFCFSNDDPKGTCPLAFIYLYIYFYYFLMRQNLKEQFAGILSNAQQKNIPAKEVYLTLNNDCIFPNELSEVIWLRDNFIV